MPTRPQSLFTMLGTITDRDLESGGERASELNSAERHPSDLISVKSESTHTCKCVLTAILNRQRGTLDPTTLFVLALRRAMMLTPLRLTASFADLQSPTQRYVEPAKSIFSSDQSISTTDIHSKLYPRHFYMILCFDWLLAVCQTSRHWYATRCWTEARPNFGSLFCTREIAIHVHNAAAGQRHYSTLFEPSTRPTTKAVRDIVVLELCEGLAR